MWSLAGVLMTEHWCQALSERKSPKPKSDWTERENHGNLGKLGRS